MSDFLFDVPEVKSPRLLWLEKHGILTDHSALAGVPPWMALIPLPEDKGKTLCACLADNGRRYDEADLVEYGETQDEAITNLAIRAGIKLWNEEGGQP